MVKDVKTGDVIRADHLVKNVLEARLVGNREARGQAASPAKEDKKDKRKKKKAGKITAVTLAQLDNYSGPELGNLCRKFDIRNLDADNEVTEPQESNLMFASSICFLRPETAQGHSINFSRLLDYNNGRVPFASAQIGRSFRNEISPRAGLLRVRELTMAEIEHFVDPEDKSHPRFKEMRDVELVLFNRHVQSAGSATPMKMSMARRWRRVSRQRDACIFHGQNSPVLGEIGINPDQCADRAAYDLTAHSASPQTLDEPALIKLKEERSMGVCSAAPYTKLFQLPFDPYSTTTTTITIDGKNFEISPELLRVERRTFKQSGKFEAAELSECNADYVNILQMSLNRHLVLAEFYADFRLFGVWVLSLPPVVAPTKVLIVPLSAKEEFEPLVKEVSSKLRRAGIFSRVDDSNTSIGKRYSRNDELGTPYGVAIDFACEWERDTMSQRIGSIDDVLATVTDLVDNIGSEIACL
ncbi:class II aaRS and biotin synthetase [Gymnopus androsaceus JB14]|uniref:Class II aaRS and biotin synthetase n=1 Tax=Gymnopus androsaceus JB14 TaxID=1447944 RepID=A0A6A4GXG7_9AGAR|nr:class II aaRS and biotin synthetase [Gymnopus androsaceus JB14]